MTLSKALGSIEPINLWVLAPAIESGFLTLSTVIAWADRSIIELETPPSWLLDLCVAKTEEQASGILLLRWDQVRESEGSPEPDWTEVYLGFLYLKYERGGLSMADLLGLAGEFADMRNDSYIHCESFYYLLNEIDGGGPTIPSDRPMAERVSELFAPMVESAGEYLRLLPPGLDLTGAGT